MSATPHLPARVRVLALVPLFCALAGCPQPIHPSQDAGWDAGIEVPGTPDGSVGADGGDSPDGCVPLTCADLPSGCGALTDGCGAPLTCQCDVARSCSAEPEQGGVCDCPDPSFIARVADSGGGFIGMFNSLALDASGGAHLVYVAGDNGVRYLHLPPREAAFSASIEDIDTGFAASGARVAVDAQGAVHVVYYGWKNNGGNFWLGDVWYARRAPDGEWTRSRVVNAGEMLYVAVDHADIALDATGRIHLLYYTFTYNRADLWHAWSDTGSGWVTAPLAAGAEASTWTSTGSVSLRQAADGTLHALYFDYGTGSLRHATRAAAMPWVNHPKPVASPRTAQEWAGLFSSLAFDPSGTLHATYSTNRTGEILLWHASFDGGAWQTGLVDPASGGALVGYYNSLAVDAQDGLHVAYWDSENDDLKYAHRPAGGAWSAQTAVSVGKVGAHAALAVDPHGSVHVAFFEVTDSTNRQGQLRYATRCR